MAKNEDIVTNIMSRMAERLSESIDYQTKELLSRHNFLSIQDARNNGYEVVVEQIHGISLTISLCKIVDSIEIVTNTNFTYLSKEK